MTERQKKKVVLYVGGFRLPDQNAAAHRVINNGKLLRNAGYEVVYLGIGDSREKAEHYGFDCWAMPYTTKRLYSIARFREIYRHYAGRVAAVIAYNYPAIALWRLLRFSRRHGIRIVADCTEWYGVQGERFVQSMIKGLDSFLRMRVIQPRLDGLIAISSYLRGYYEKKLPTLQLPPLVDLHDPIWHQEKMPQGEDAPIRLVFAGTVGRKKDALTELVDAVLKDVSGVELQIIGMEKADFLRLHPAYLDQLERPACPVYFLGRKSHRETIGYVCAADFTIFSRKNNLVNTAGFPTKFAESISCGIPVITTNTSDLAAYLHHGENGFFMDMDHPAQSVKAYLSSDPDLLRSMKANVRRDTFDIAKYNEFAVWFEKTITAE